MEEKACIEEKFCRICYLDDDFADLRSPCRCLGSVRYIHSRCLIRWLKIRSGKCELCGYRYAIKKSIVPFDERRNPCLEKCKIFKIIWTILLMDWIHFGEMSFLFCGLCVLNSFKSVDLLYQVGLILGMELFYYTVQFSSCVLFIYHQEWCLLNMKLMVLDYGVENDENDELANVHIPWIQRAAEQYIQLVTRTQNIMEVIESIED